MTDDQLREIGKSVYYNNKIVGTNKIHEIEENFRNGKIREDEIELLIHQVKNLNERMWKVNEYVDYVATQMSRTYYGTGELLSEEEIEEYQGILCELVI